MMLIFAVFALQAAQPVTAQPVTAQPVTAPPLNGDDGWGVESSADRCSIGRRFADGQVTILITQTILDSDNDIFYIKIARRYNGASVGKQRLSVGIGEQEFASVNANENSPSPLPLVGLYAPAIAHSVLMRLGATKSFWVRSDKGAKIELSADGLGTAFGELNQCLDNSARRLGFEQANIPKLRRQPRQIGSINFSDRDYPKEAKKLVQEGNSSVRYLVDKAGRADDCEVLQSSGSDILDRATCDIVINRARYTPAADMTGKAVAVPMVTTLYWQLPR